MIQEEVLFAALRVAGHFQVSERQIGDTRGYQIEPNLRKGSRQLFENFAVRAADRSGFRAFRLVQNKRKI